VVGGVENVILAHVRLFTDAGYPVTVLAGRGRQDALPPEAEFAHLPEMDSQHSQIVGISRELDQGHIPEHFEEMVTQIAERLRSTLKAIDILIVHNVLTKHFNLPLTAALIRLLNEGVIQRCVAWCHDITWTSSNSREKVHSGYPWDLLRTYRSDVTYATVSQERQSQLAGLFSCPPERIRVIYNGVDPGELLALSDDGLALINRLQLWESDLNLLMPVRVTQAKNIELALLVAAVLKERGIRTKLVVTGPPDPHDPLNMQYFQHLRTLRDGLGLTNQMHFVYESGAEPTEPLLVDMQSVAELLRVSDVLFMPSHREGFGMPILEAGLIGIPVFCMDTVPAANEIGGKDVIRFSPDAQPFQVADLILQCIQNSSVFRLRRHIRQNLTWNSLFQQQILPLVNGGDS
jgi:glycosyltransferase involved in cell wall biosynthesis